MCYHKVMTSINALFTEGNPKIPKKIIESYPYIVIDQSVNSGWPHIKNTRILATDIFKAQVKGYSYNSLIEDFKSMGVQINKKALEQAYMFTIEWLHYLNAKKNSRISL